MGTECSTFTRSTRNCTEARGRTGWNTGMLTGPGAFWEAEDVNGRREENKCYIPLVTNQLLISELTYSTVAIKGLIFLLQYKHNVFNHVQILQVHILHVIFTQMSYNQGYKSFQIDVCVGMFAFTV